MSGGQAAACGSAWKSQSEGSTVCVPAHDAFHHKGGSQKEAANYRRGHVSRWIFSLTKQPAQMRQVEGGCREIMV